MIQDKVHELKNLGRLSESVMDEFDELLQQIQYPINYDEGKVLITLFPAENSVHGVEWALLHAFETAANSCSDEEYGELLKMCPSEYHKEMLEIRWENDKKHSAKISSEPD